MPERRILPGDVAVAHDVLVLEVDAEQRPQPGHLHGHFQLAANLPQPVPQVLGDLGQAAVDLGRQLLQRDRPGQHRRGVGVEGASVSHAWAGSRVVQLHDVLAASEGAYGKAAADNLAQRGHVRRDAVVFLGPARCHAEADDFVEDQHNAVLGCEVAKHCEELVGGGQHTHRTQHWLHDNGGQLVLVLLQYLPCRSGLVEGNHHH